MSQSSSPYTDKILIFTDGACSGNPGPGGFGSIIAFPDGRVHEIGGARAETTNNQMEMVAVIQALAYLDKTSGDVWVLTDSTYVIRGITQWIWGWKKNGWITSEGKEVGNIESWKSLDREVQNRKKYGSIEWKYVRGHTEVPGNERCDEIAVLFSQKKRVELFSGKLLDYPYAIYDIPEDLSLPPMREKTEKKEAFSYLSYVNGKLQRHQTWKECEAVVKGRPGAKFKKAMSSDEEASIVKSWGLSPDLLK